MNAKKTCSIIIPVFNEAPNLEELYTQLTQVTDSLNDRFDWEFVLIDDGSDDQSVDIIGELHARDSRIKLVRLSRNFGSHVAITAGLDYVSGEATIIMAADLQDPPEVIRSLLVKWQEGNQIVWATRESRDDSLSKRVTARLYYSFIRRVALPDYPKEGTGSFCLLDHQVVEVLRSCSERTRVTYGLISWTGFQQAQVSYHRAKRFAGQSKWRLRQMVKSGIDASVMFSFMPVRMISYLGLLVSSLSLLYAFFIIIRALLGGVDVPGWSSVMAVVLLLGGVQLIMLGILGEYLWRSLEEGKQRPLYIVRETLGMKQPTPTGNEDLLRQPLPILEGP